MSKIHYVLNHVFNSDKTKIVMLEKKKGPVFLLNKFTVPGGKIERHENIKEAASREMLEETNLQVHPQDWKVFETYETTEYVLYKLIAISADLSSVKQMENEPVFVKDIKNLLDDVNLDKYTKDFFSNLHQAISYH